MKHESSAYQVFAQFANHVVHFIDQRRRAAGSRKPLLPLHLLLVLRD